MRGNLASRNLEACAGLAGAPGSSTSGQTELRGHAMRSRHQQRDNPPGAGHALWHGGGMALLAGLRSRALVSQLALLALTAVFPQLTGAAGDSAQLLEQRVKAAFLFKFAGYVDWPEDLFPNKETPLVIGVSGADVLAEELNQVIAGRTLNGRPVSVRRLSRGESLANLHVLFVGQPELARLNESNAKTRAILTVTDVDKGLDQGSVINFITVERRVRFEISLDAARRNGLKIGAPLLSVATHVQG